MFLWSQPTAGCTATRSPRGALVAPQEIPDALADAVGAGELRLRGLAGDRAKAFSWASSAERVWALHAEL